MIRASNFKLEAMLESLRPLMSKKGKLGYVIARNFRVLADLTVDYIKAKEALIKKYGHPIENGEWQINSGSVHFNTFLNEMSPIADIEQDFNVMTITYEEVYDDLTAEEILSIDWMLTEKET